MMDAAQQSKTDVTACILCSRNCGLSVEIKDNQFVKIKGDPEHPFLKVTFAKSCQITTLPTTRRPFDHTFKTSARWFISRSELGCCHTRNC